MDFICANNITRNFGRGTSKVAALNDISFTIQSGEFVAVMGESGAGKSTLLKVLGAMSTPTRGQYIVDGMDIYDLRSEQRANFRREYLGFVFQSFHLVPYLKDRKSVV